MFKEYTGDGTSEIPVTMYISTKLWDQLLGEGPILQPATSDGALIWADNLYVRRDENLVGYDTMFGEFEDGLEDDGPTGSYGKPDTDEVS